MKTYTIYDKPLKVYGIPFFEENKKLVRLPDELINKLPNLSHLGRRCAGARVAFKTDSPSITVKVVLKTLSVYPGMSIYACQSVQVLLGERDNCVHLGIVSPSDYETKVFQRTFFKTSELEQITLYFPRNEQVEMIEVIVEDGAIVTEPTPFKYSKPVVLYGSSITEGGFCCNGFNSYIAILSRWLDFDFYNLGFSGNARGELVMADYINTFDMGAFVYDYDHNAPTVEHLRNTHKPFFDRIRDVHPNIPILMMTRPCEVYNEDMKSRREVVKATYDVAINSGDKNVYFIDGETFYGDSDRNLCSIDTCHPNDIGFYRMACAMRPVLKKMLDSIGE
ncbi:MAG: hypothetical protein IIW02_01565 [Clostridia bacterium]|nr:hypothetical protein [Clostridia bacterium]